MGGLGETFLTEVADIATQFGNVLVNATGSITDIIFDIENGGLTVVGTGLALAMGIGAVYLIFRMVRGLIKQNNRG